MKTHWPITAGVRDERGQQELAAALGIDVELLREASRQLAEARRRTGVDAPIGPRRQGTATALPQLSVRMPKPAIEAWYRLAARLHMRPTSMLRGAVHEYLLDGIEPKRFDMRWVVDGRVYATPSGAKERAGVMATVVTRAARDALRVRAERLGVSRHTLLTALLNDVLSGRRIVRRPLARIGMYADVRRYLK